MKASLQPLAISALLFTSITGGLWAEEEISLAEQLSTRAAAAGKKSDPARSAEYARGIQVVANSGIVEAAKQVGDKAPDFTLKNASGKEVKLSEMLKDGPVVLTWYRGGWCPYCNIAMAAFQQKLPEIEATGAQLVALTPELPDHSKDTKKENNLEFEVLTDLNHQVADQYGLVFELTPEVAELYKPKNDLIKFNGEDAGARKLPLAATYVIDQEGIIRWAFLNANYRERAEPSEVVEFLKEMK
ncbi:peroxiredoxin-like family protein [Luteolibacter sp. AS25]|uniref:peroxiredoxin-like family protein n=1 Tax=Luteolibacter sp. AS25 TaxID=3135776 RepID=UPI00398A5CE9